ncbi:hypothetical protein BH11ACT8_BH11ACT8_04970 [soil metagenome]
MNQPTQPHGRNVPAVAWGLALTGLVGAWLAVTSVSQLSTGFVVAGKQSRSFSSLSGLSAVVSHDGWRGQFSGAGSGALDPAHQWRTLLHWFLALDLLLVLAYLLVMWLIARRAGGHARTVIRAAVLGAAAADLVEDLLMLLAADHRVTNPDTRWGGWWLLQLTTGLKWAALMAAVGTAAVVLVSRPNARRALSRTRRALWIQRYSLLAFLPIAFLACVPSGKLADQLPDIERRWLQDGDRGLRDTVAALLAGLVVAAAVFALGRVRADCAHRREDDPGHQWPWSEPDGTARDANLWLWLFAPASVVIVGLALVRWDVATIDPPRLAVFALVPLVVVVVSHALRLAPLPAPVQPAPGPDGPSPATVLAVGDALALASISVAGLGMVRAWTGWLALNDAVPDESADFPARKVTLAILTAALLALAPWLAHRPLRRRTGALAGRSDFSGWSTLLLPLARLARLAQPGYTWTGMTAPGEPVPSSGLLRGAFLAAAGVLFCTFVRWPVWWAEQLGVVAAFTLALADLVVILGVTVAYAQESRPPEMFHNPLLRLSATPVIPVVLTTMVLSSVVGDPASVHGVVAQGLVPPRPTMHTAFDTWLAQRGDCVLYTTFADGTRTYQVRPMLMIAAEGGGIRATHWTAAALAEIASSGPRGCGSRNTLFSGGASGGALALSIARYSKDPLADVDAISGPEALGSGMISFFTGDVLASAAGLRVLTSTPERDRAALDRAGLMETVWEDSWRDTRAADAVSPDFVDPVSEHRAPGTVTGHLVLTSTDTFDGCRGLLSQIDLGGVDTGAPSLGSPDCGGYAAGPNSYDVLGLFGHRAADPHHPERPDDHCVGNLPAITAGLIASRFPYVTPSAVIGPCRGFSSTPLIDGGVAENSGLGTIVDLAPTWAGLVRSHNDRVLSGAAAGPLVVPIVVYLDNGPATDYAAKPRGRAPLESLLPIVGALHARSRQTTPSGYLRQAVDVTGDALCGGSPPRAVGSVSSADAASLCTRLRKAYAGQRQVFVVHQSTRPSLSVPLGWVLSHSSEKRLDDDLASARDSRCPSAVSTMPAAEVDPACLRGIGTLGDLLATVSTR